MQIEKSFFRSLKNLSSLYGLASIPVSQKVFPQKIWTAYQFAKSQLEEAHGNLHLLITVQGSLPVVCTASVMDTGTTLHYIPLYPLHKLLQDKKKKPLAKLLLSAFGYLHKAGVPLCDSSSFMGYQMEMVQEWVHDTPEEWEQSEYQETCEQIESTICNCRKLSAMISQKTHLNQFESRLKRIRVDDNNERMLVAAIEELFILFQQYPQRNFRDQIRDRFILPDEEERIFVEQYLSFYWGDETWFDQQVEETIRVHLQELSIADEPTALQLFSEPPTGEHHDLDFEFALLTCIGALNTALYAL